MGSVVLNQVRSDLVYSSYTPTMLGGAVNNTSQSTTPSDSVYRPSASSTTTTTPTTTSFTAPPSTAQLASQPSNYVPAYVDAPVSQSHHHHPHYHQHQSSSSSLRQTSHPSSMTSSAPAPAAVAAAPASQANSPDSPRLQPTFRSFRSLGGSEATSPSRIKVRDLSHIQSFASEEFLSAAHPPQSPWAQERQYEISSMPVPDIIEMVAGLLTKITATNDIHHEHVHRNIPPPDGTATLSPQATSVLAFHGKNVPSITILSYLTRIHKYCPTTYEVFLSLLVYFDRMTEMVNRGHLERLRRRAHRPATAPSGSASPAIRPAPTSSASSLSSSSSSPSPSSASMVTPPLSSTDRPGSATSYPASLEDDDSLSHFFVVDSFNIHRLVIAGVTCASKFFSDVFYTNSRYAKVGGLPLVELNHLELQFLLLNDFRLAVPVEELEAYGTMLVEFYAREIVAQQQHQQQLVAAPIPVNPSMVNDSSEGMYMRRDKPQSDPAQVQQTPTPP
ncbi:hypothetical protein ASPZODRAFT_146484 [Penicilliopsis zonata CBS 506.65]|uniref:Cyclin-domain-containing protein n=1 Tax=Penicilliopsis zonata CBS 506.65 TaxID=1073090 RepID=A0A1L9S6X3_9EURO|nr:hypothetical protein ASPZODRAFT_146484 [Penicilliopsis zonata CBS 506.65]OJJ42915.1 hypothetical protein ASPZODRAFT_146484 [Penicilliopsis zonata CBS 506.65]